MMFHPMIGVSQFGGKVSSGLQTFDLGNVTALSTFPINYGVSEKAKDFLSKAKEGDLPRTLPFQLQIFYHKMDSTKVVRVISHRQLATLDRSRAEGTPSSPIPAPTSASVQMAG